MKHGLTVLIFLAVSMHFVPPAEAQNAQKEIKACQEKVMSQINAVPESQFLTPKDIAKIDATEGYIKCLKSIINEQSKILFDPKTQKAFMQGVEKLDQDSGSVYLLLWTNNKSCPGNCGLYDTEQARTSAAGSMENLLDAMIQVEEKKNIK
jgi:hypothetical protein